MNTAPQISELHVDHVRFGQALRERREAMGMDIDSVAESLRLRKSWVIALEQGDLQSFPGVVYAKGYAHNYARLLGAQDLLDHPPMIQVHHDIARANAQQRGARMAHTPVLRETHRTPFTAPPQAKNARRSARDTGVFSGYGLLISACIAVLVFLVVWGVQTYSEEAPSVAPVEVVRAAPVAAEPSPANETTLLEPPACAQAEMTTGMWPPCYADVTSMQQEVAFPSLLRYKHPADLLRLHFIH
jgi:transcriptional regulator with XRE-family HTH domain